MFTLPEAIADACVACLLAILVDDPSNGSSTSPAKREAKNRKILTFRNVIHVEIIYVFLLHEALSVV